MDFQLSKELEMLRKAVREFASKKIAPNADQWDKDHHFPYEEAIKPMGQLGFFGTVAGFVWYYEGIQKIGPTKAGLFINFVPVSAVILAFFVLREPMTTSLLLGTLLVVTGVFLTNRRAPAAANRPQAPGRSDSAFADSLEKRG